MVMKNKAKVKIEHGTGNSMDSDELVDRQSTSMVIYFARIQCFG